MIPAQQVADDVLAEAARRGGADDTIVLIQDSSEASLRWAGSSMTTNGESVKRSIAVISVLRQGDQTRVGSVLTEDADPAALADLVAASQSEAASAPPSRDAMPLLGPGEAVGESWDAEIVPTSAGVFGSLAADLSTGFDGPDLCTAMPATNGRPPSWRRRPGCGADSPSRQGRWRSMPNAGWAARGPGCAHPNSSMCPPKRCCVSSPNG
ncbi:putative Zn-dependent protease-like protein [Mycobacteroides abscessus]|nr:putative Zn-dependent protease-like protein [Mycobacteroides abscessus]